jgi:Domain of unknown function (DUF1963)
MPPKKRYARLSDEFTSDLERWIAIFPIDPVPRDSRGGGTINCPQALAFNEQIRREAFVPTDPTVPTDFFLYALGEPPRRDVTKVGGVPWRPRTLAWPLSHSREPMTFLTQFRFAESAELFRTLPGDVLLVFVRDFRPGYEPENYFHFEWHSLDETNLVRPTEMPPPGWDFCTCFGVRIRTVDYDFADPGVPAKRLAPLIAQEGRFRQNPIWSATKICRLDGMKIGGLPSWNYLNDPNIDGLQQKRFLCSLAGITPPFDLPYPWVNRPTPRPFPSKTPMILDPKETLYLMDGFNMYFFLDSDGRTIGYYQAA